LACDISYYYVHTYNFYFSILDRSHKTWEFVIPDVNQGECDYNGLCKKIDDIVQCPFRETLDKKSTFFDVEHLENCKITVRRHVQVPGELVLTLGALHQGYGMVSVYFIQLYLL